MVGPATRSCCAGALGYQLEEFVSARCGGGGIGGLTAAIALLQRGFAVTVIEKDPDWSVYGVGIIQHGNVLRAAKALGILDQYVGAGVGFDAVEVYAPDGTRVARVPSPRLLDGYPANLGISRPALHRMLGSSATSAGAMVRLGVTVTAIHDRGSRVEVEFSVPQRVHGFPVGPISGVGSGRIRP
jgi:2-polyprenyl-6-methoxyphenol hydroxylase-like FAD-dependent oxidoreductase